MLEEWGETFFHFSKRLKIDFDFDSKKLSVEIDGQPLEDDRMLEVGIQEYYLINSETGFGSRIDDRCIIRGNVGGLALEVKSGKRKRGLLG